MKINLYKNQYMLNVVLSNLIKINVLIFKNWLNYYYCILIILIILNKIVLNNF